MGTAAEEPAAFSRARLAALLDALDTGIAFHDRENRIVFSNRAADEILRLAPGELVGRTSRAASGSTAFEDGVPALEEDRPAVVALRTGEPQRDVVMRVTRH